MPRPFNRRTVGVSPDVTVFKPSGVPARALQWTTLTLDEYEAVRLVDHMGLDHAQAAERMQVSRPTVTRIVASARQKIARVLVEGQALMIQGGPVAMPSAVAPVDTQGVPAAGPGTVPVDPGRDIDAQRGFGRGRRGGRGHGRGHGGGRGRRGRAGGGPREDMP